MVDIAIVFADCLIAGLSRSLFLATKMYRRLPSSMSSAGRPVGEGVGADDGILFDQGNRANMRNQRTVEGSVASADTA